MMQNRFEAYYNSNNGTGRYFHGVKSFLRIDRADNVFDKLDRFMIENSNSYVALAFSYQLKNEVERLTNSLEDGTSFPALIAVVPESVYEIKNDEAELIKGAKVPTEIIKRVIHDSVKVDDKINFRERTSREKYLFAVEKLKSHIQQGDIYEVNYCQEYFAENVHFDDPISLYHKVNGITNAPFSVYFNFDEHFVMSGSPERFIQRKGQRLISQPIKGTVKRGENVEEDLLLKETLRNDPKERSENVMIVDLVRNDLSKLATKNSVQVDELFGIYSFDTVHQMISTVSCNLKSHLSLSDIIKASFPMGSMTGAPKISAMKLINTYEDFARSIFSGSIGYMKPNGDFDLNVIIRTLIYNDELKYLSCPVGGAITINSDPEKEYNECLVKVGKILEAFKHE
jgi:para-aminobenzoate synthetase component 1